MSLKIFLYEKLIVTEIKITMKTENLNEKNH